MNKIIYSYLARTLILLVRIFVEPKYTVYNYYFPKVQSSRTWDYHDVMNTDLTSRAGAPAFALGTKTGFRAPEKKTRSVRHR